MEHACNALSEAETAINAQLSNHAWRAQTPMGLGHISGEGERAIISGSDQGAGRGRICMWMKHEVLAGVNGADSARSTEHACTALGVAELPFHACLSNHAGQHMLGVWRPRSYGWLR